MFSEFDFVSNNIRRYWDVLLKKHPNFFNLPEKDREEIKFNYIKVDGLVKLCGTTPMGSCQCGDIRWSIWADTKTRQFSYWHNSSVNYDDHHIPYTGNAVRKLSEITHIEKWEYNPKLENPFLLEQFSDTIKVIYNRYWRNSRVELEKFYNMKEGEFVEKLEDYQMEPSLILSYRENMGGMMWDTCFLSYNGEEQPHELWEELSQKWMRFQDKEFHNSL